MLYNIFPNPYQCTKMIIRRLRRCLWGVCCYASTVLQEWNPKNQYAPTLPKNLKSKNKNESGIRVGAYCIRPTNDPPKGGEGPAFGRVQAFAIHGMALCGAYAIRPYPDGRKMIAAGACFAVLPEKQAAFRGCYGVGGGKCGTFSCPHVGAYCIRPTNVPFMGRMVQMIDR